ncbi:MAG: hypothetical protein RLY16_1361 [Bacteroidota bacterium]
MRDTVSFFLPTRKGSKRVINKNTQPFAGFEGGIFELKIKQLKQSKLLTEIVISTNDEECIAIAQKLTGDDDRFKIIERPEDLCLDTTPLQDLIVYAGAVCTGNHILWGHATTPLVEGADYDLAIEAYLKVLPEGFDSLVSVLPIKNFLIDAEKKTFLSAGAEQGKWPRTQDLKLIYEVNHAVFLTARITYTQHKNRIGQNLYYYEMSKIKSVDIDWEEDFLIAEAVYIKVHA